MLTAILAFFQAIPAITGGINNFVSKYFDSKVQITVARYGCDAGVAKALVTGIVAEGQTRVDFLKVASQSWFLMLILGGFAFPIIAFMAKVVVWDTMLGWGSTPAIRGEVATWVNIVITGIFGSTSVLGVGAMYFSKR